MSKLRKDLGSMFIKIFYNSFTTSLLTLFITCGSASAYKQQLNFDVAQNSTSPQSLEGVASESDESRVIRESGAGLGIQSQSLKTQKTNPVSEFYAITAEYSWKCTAKQQLWSLKRSKDHKYLRHFGLQPQFIEFVYDESSKKDSSFCIEETSPGRYLIQAKQSNEYINNHYLNVFANNFDADKQEAGDFSIQFSGQPPLSVDRTSADPLKSANKNIEPKNVSAKKDNKFLKILLKILYAFGFFMVFYMLTDKKYKHEIDERKDHVNCIVGSW